jgi:hypothetical protein
MSQNVANENGLIFVEDLRDEPALVSADVEYRIHYIPDHYPISVGVNLPYFCKTAQRLRFQSHHSLFAHPLPGGRLALLPSDTRTSTRAGLARFICFSSLSISQGPSPRCLKPGSTAKNLAYVGIGRS